MKHISKLALIGCLLLLVGCDRSEESGKTVLIESGRFVTTEPSALYGSLSKSDKCSLDTINGKQRPSTEGWEIKRGQPIDLQGWAFSSDGKKAAPEVFVQLTGQVDTYYAVTSSRSLRSDANEHLSADPTLKGGFQLQAKTDVIEPGSYEISVIQSFPDRRETCENGVNLIVN